MRSSPIPYAQCLIWHCLNSSVLIIEVYSYLSEIFVTVVRRVKVDHLEVDGNSGEGENLLHVGHHLGSDAVTRNHRHGVTAAISKGTKTTSHFKEAHNFLINHPA